MQEFVQLPLTHIWQQQLRNVMQQALSHELSSLPQPLLAESTRDAEPAQSDHQTRRSTLGIPHAARWKQHADSAESALPAQARDHSWGSMGESAEAGHKGGSDAHSDTVSTSAEQLLDSVQAGYATTSSERLPLEALPVQHTAQTQQASHGRQVSQSEEQPLPTLPVDAMSGQTSGQTTGQTLISGQAGPGKVPLQATHRGLPKQATPSEPTFLRNCLTELLRITHPIQSQYQPLLCGWYTTGECMSSFACTP